MADIKLKVTRDQLFRVFKDHEMVKQFERLIDYMNTLMPASSTDTSIAAFTAETRTNELANEIHEIKKEIEDIKQLPIKDSGELINLIKRVDSLEQKP